jgi:hypothetical protein
MREFKSSSDLKSELTEAVSLLETSSDLHKNEDIAVLYLTTLVSNMKTMRNAPINDFILALDSVSMKIKDRAKLEEIWTALDLLVLTNVSTMSGNTLSNAIYYFCKYK